MRRPKAIKVKFTNIKGSENEIVCDGLLSRIFQHEIDHLDGVDMEDKALKHHDISLLRTEEAFDKFYNENRQQIIEY